MNPPPSDVAAASPGPAAAATSLDGPERTPEGQEPGGLRAIGLIDLGAGNVRSVANALAHLGLPFERITAPDQLADCSRIVLPGVGAFRAFMDKLRDRGFLPALEREVRERGKPYLGICVGMQILCEIGEEFGETQGLGWLPGRCRRLVESAACPVPHVGWNDVEPAGQADRLLSGLDGFSTFYFVHSYHFAPDEPADIVATTNHGGPDGPFASIVRRGHIAGVQFHPEKSQHAGLRLLRNFATGEGQKPKAGPC